MHAPPPRKLRPGAAPTQNSRLLSPTPLKREKPGLTILKHGPRRLQGRGAEGATFSQTLPPTQEQRPSRRGSPVSIRERYMRCDTATGTRRLRQRIPGSMVRGRGGRDQRWRGRYATGVLRWYVRHSRNPGKHSSRHQRWRTRLCGGRRCSQVRHQRNRFRGVFVIVPDTGQIRTREGVAYDYETKNRYSVTVGVEDGGGNRDTIDVTIRIENLVSSCELPANFRVNYSDERLTLRWSPSVRHERVRTRAGLRDGDTPWNQRSMERSPHLPWPEHRRDDIRGPGQRDWIPSPCPPNQCKKEIANGRRRYRGCQRLTTLPRTMTITTTDSDPIRWERRSGSFGS